MTRLVVYFGLALGISFVCSILEAALLSVTPSHIAKLEQDRPRVGGRLRTLKSHIESGHRRTNRFSDGLDTSSIAAYCRYVLFCATRPTRRTVARTLRPFHGR